MREGKWNSINELNGVTGWFGVIFHRQVARSRFPRAGCEGAFFKFRTAGAQHFRELSGSFRRARCVIRPVTPRTPATVSQSLEKQAVTRAPFARRPEPGSASTWQKVGPNRSKTMKDRKRQHPCLSKRKSRTSVMDQVWWLHADPTCQPVKINFCFPFYDASLEIWKRAFSPSDSACNL